MHQFDFSDSAEPRPAHCSTRASVKLMQHQGFTLLEMLIALVVIAVVGLAISTAVGNMVGQTHGLERRLVAHWVAENHLVRLRLARIANTDALATGRDTERVRMSGRNWRVEREVGETTHPWLRRVEVEVYEVTDGDDIGPLDTLVGFLGRY